MLDRIPPLGGIGRGHGAQCVSGIPIQSALPSRHIPRAFGSPQAHVDGLCLSLPCTPSTKHESLFSQPPFSHLVPPGIKSAVRSRGVSENP